MTLTNRHKGLLLTFLGILIITPDSLLLRLMDTHFLTVLFWRCGLAALVLIVVRSLIYRCAWMDYVKLTWVDWLQVALLLVGNVCFVLSIQLTFVSHTLIILALTPLVTSLLSRWWLAETVSNSALLAMMTSFFGVCIIAFGSTVNSSEMTHYVWGDLLALLAMICMSVNLMLVRKQQRPQMSLYLTYSYGITAIGIFALSLLGYANLELSSSSIMPALIMGLVVSPFGFLLLLSGPKYLPAGEVGLFLLIETVLGPFWVWWVLNEQLGTHEFVGGGLVLCSLVFYHALSLFRQRNVNC